MFNINEQDGIMNTYNKKSEIIELAIHAFREIFPEIELLRKGEKLEISYQDETIFLDIIVKNSFTSQNAFNSLVKLLSSSYKNKILITEFIPKKIRCLLKEKNIFFLDTVGNAFISGEKLFLFVSDKNKTQKTSTPKLSRLFYPSGLKLIFNLINYPQLINENYRKIADVSHISLGSVSNLMNELIKSNYMIRLDGDRFKLINVENLIAKWIEAYPKRFRPKLIKGTYRFANPEHLKNWWNISFETFPNTFWGSEAAGEILTNSIKAERLTLYTNDNILDLIKKLRLVPDENGLMEILDIFWDVSWVRDNMALEGSNELVPIFLIYADLVISQNDRNLEGTKILYERYLSTLF